MRSRDNIDSILSNASYSPRRSKAVAKIQHPGLAKAHIRERIIGLCRDAHEITLLQNVSAQDLLGAAFAAAFTNECQEVALALEHEHQGLFDELTILANNIRTLTNGSEPEEQGRGKISDSIMLVMEQLKTY